MRKTKNETLKGNRKGKLTIKQQGYNKGTFQGKLNEKLTGKQRREAERNTRMMTEKKRVIFSYTAGYAVSKLPSKLNYISVLNNRKTKRISKR